MKTADFAKELEREIAHNKREAEREMQLARLKDTMSKYEGEDEIISASEMKRRLEREGVKPYLSTGVEGLDRIIKGFRQKQLIILSAPPKAGKTSFCLHLTSLMEKHNPLWLPLEQDLEEIVSVCLERGVEVPHMFAPEKNKFPPDTDWIEQKIIEGIAKYDAKIVFIDHLSFVRPSNAVERERYVQVGRSVEKIKEMAKVLEIPIVLVSHLKKANPTEIPTTEDLYESAMIHQLCDMVLMLWRECYTQKKLTHFTDKVLLSVLANRRHGQTGHVRFRYENYRFVENDLIVFRHEQKEKDSSDKVKEKW